MQSENENGTDYHKPEDERIMGPYESDTSWHKAPPIPNGFRIKSKKRGSNFTKSKKRK
jgi:hypothetical protein